MRNSVALLEREGRINALTCTTRLACLKRSDETFSLWLVEESGLGKVCRILGRRIETSGAFINAVLSVNDWSYLRIDYETIQDAICDALARVDPEFAQAVRSNVRNRLAESSGPRAA